MVASAVVLAGCGSGDGGGAGSGGLTSGSGTVTEAWADFCTATFTEDFGVLDSFGDPMFTARAGEQYLLSSFSAARAELIYLTGVGPEIFDIDAETSGAFPFTSTCVADGNVTYYAVFADVTVFADEALTSKICDLVAGTALPVAGSSRGYALADGGSLNGPATYQIYLNAFSAQCGGNASGYISVSQTEVFGTHTWLVPIIDVVGPN